MIADADSLLIVALAFALYGVATSRIAAAIQAMALQGAALGLVPLALLHGEVAAGHIVAMTVGTIAIKAILIPWLLLRTLRATRIRREVEPYVSMHTTVLLAALLVGLCFWLGRALELPRGAPSDLLVPTGLSLVALGLLLLVNRKKAISQVVGFLVLENGVYVFGQCLASAVPFAVELGILLDMLVGVFVMGIAIQHISRAFDDVDVDALSSLKE
jgi:hydrogenase-4 component E